MIKVKVATRSEKGPVRKENEDSLLCLKKIGLFAVADGMGGGDDGALASQMVCKAVGKCDLSGSGRKKRLSEAVGRVNLDIGEYARSHGLRQMGSTVAMLLLGESMDAPAYVGHVGDSRVYRIRGGSASQLTRDHTIGAELAAKVGGATGAGFSVRSNPLAHVLTRAVGTEASVEVEWRKIDVRNGDRFLICTDGVHDVVGTDELGDIVTGGGVEKSANRLASTVIGRGAPDNYSFVLVEIGGEE